MSTAIYTLTSALHDEQAVRTITREFLESIGIQYEYKGNNFTDYGTHALDLIHVCTGGTEGIFKSLLPDLRKKSKRPIYLLTSGKSNSLAASMEILSFLRQNDLKGEIIHGSADYINKRVHLLKKIEEAYKQLYGCRLGIIGEPSDWLISSQANEEKIKDVLGVNLIKISIQELIETIKTTPLIMPEESVPNATISQALPGANQIYMALKTIIKKYQLHGFTLRCFDLLTSIHNTGCLALAKLNAEGIVAGCEGDVPAMLSMIIAQTLIGVSGFQANPANINPETGEILFAHCTIPLNMVDHYEFDTHFESGIGIGIRGYMKEGPVTIFKVSGDLSRRFIEEGMLIENQTKPNLCRTQQVILLSDKSKATYFLSDPIGNHHIILPGHHKELLSHL